jgi:hypothetical protein
MTPEQLLRMWVKASYSPCTSLMKCSVALGSLRMASRLIISVKTVWLVGNCSESRERYLSSWGDRPCVRAMRCGSFPPADAPGR